MKSNHELYKSEGDEDYASSTATEGILETDIGISRAESFHFKVNEKLPFVPEFIFGLSRGNKLLGLGNGRMCYAASHFVVILNYENNTQNFLMGHKNNVSGISADADRNLIVTGDSGAHESVIYLWKADQWQEPIAKLKPPSKLGTRLLVLSHDGKYLLTLSEGLRKAVLNLWEILDGGKTVQHGPSAVYELLQEHGRPQHIAFSTDCTEFSIITCTRNVLFLNWVSGSWTEFHPEQMSRSVGRFISSVYVSGTIRAATITSKGSVLVWSEKSPLTQPVNQKVNVDVVKLQHHSLSAIYETDGVMVIGDDRGQVRFYDQTFKTVLLWFNLEEGDGIRSMSFSPDSENRNIQFGDPLLHPDSAAHFSSVSIEKGPLRVDPRCIVDTKEFRSLLSGPQDINDEERNNEIKLQIVPRDILLHTRMGKTKLVSLRHMHFVSIHNPATDPTCATTHPSKSHLFVGDASGVLKIFNYDARELLMSSKVIHSPITSLRVSPDGHTLFVGSADGTVVFLHSILINHNFHRGSYRHSASAVLGPTFSNDSQYVAHYDAEGYVSAFRSLDRTRGRWLFLGKKTIHKTPVCTLLFGQEYVDASLYSIGYDSVLVEYDIVNSIGDKLIVKRSDFLSNLTTSSLMWCPAPSNIGPAVLISYQEGRTNVFHLSDRSKVVTGNVPILPHPIESLQNLCSYSSRPHTSEGERVAVFNTKCHLGLLKCPPESNPFEVVATYGHQTQIIFVVLSSDHKYAFVGAKNDSPVIMYRINMRALEIRSEMSSPGLEPYLNSLDGGSKGWLLQEMISSFCFAQILHQGVKSKKIREISNQVPLCEVPDLLRAVGIVSTQFSMKRLAQEIVWKGQLCTGVPGSFLTFDDFVKIVVSYDATAHLDITALKSAFDSMAQVIDEHESVISRDRFVSVLTEKGEALSLAELRYCLIALLGKQVTATENDTESDLFMDEQMKREKMFSFLPYDLTFSYLIDQVLGFTVTQANDN